MKNVALLMSAKDLGNLSLLGSSYLLGNLLFLGGCLGASFYNVYCKGLMGRFRDRDVLISGYVAATVGSLPLLLWREPGCFRSLFRLDALTAIGATVVLMATVLVMRFDAGG